MIQILNESAIFRRAPLFSLRIHCNYNDSIRVTNTLKVKKKMNFVEFVVNLFVRVLFTIFR